MNTVAFKLISRPFENFVDRNSRLFAASHEDFWNVCNAARPCQNAKLPGIYLVRSTKSSAKRLQVIVERGFFPSEGNEAFELDELEHSANL
ncbi:MAG: hypothetical protein A3J24_08600 [Deltaproteobacteria bacterium RIFCSPLOWO2_02_FULL_53_8]|nr:MAG: hypothetical protein A3J24_08600 [Deltaproteobacteria bacterium RIFCSPLOWO2_02_FULL_53_8]